MKPKIFEASKKSKKKKKRFLLIKLCVFSLAVYLVFSLISIQDSLRKKTEEYDLLIQQVEKQQLENLEAQRLLESDNYNEHIERLAREKLGLVAPNERVYIDISGK